MTNNPVYANPKGSFVNRVASFMNLLCLDITLGAFFSALFVSDLLGLDLSPVYYLVLIISVWVVYTSDHLVDAYRLKDGSHTRRHRYIYHNFRIFSSLIAVALVLDIILVLIFLDRYVLFLGLVLGLLVLIYFLILYLDRGRSYIWLQKELFVALIYVFGIWGMALLETGFHLESVEWVIFLIFFLLALSDILLLSYYEMETDSLDGHLTLAGRLGEKAVGKLILTLVAVAFISSFFLILSPTSVKVSVAGMILALMATMILGLLHFASFFRINKRYRFLSELVFWLPVLLLVYSFFG